MNLEKKISEMRKEGYAGISAEARVCQDVVLKAIAKSGLKENVTVKGGIVMRSLTGNVRRATEDIDLDFIRYSLNEDSICRFVARLNCLEEITIRVDGNIEELSHQEYRGKRVYIILEDNTGHSLHSKIDFGVHKNMQMEQEEYCFDVCLDQEGASLLINSREQIFVEKLKSLLRFGAFSSRYMDVFDLCYLTDHVNYERLRSYLRICILEDPSMRESNMDEIRSRILRTFSNRIYRANIENANRSNWMDMNVSDAFDKIIEFLKSVE